ncbi:hypothetical protein BGZ58_002926 [Dissophora ornata]|nr:hypothetical protein BGZ58_002926 [Dissophora ornata]
MPSFGGSAAPNKSNNPLQQAVNPSNNRGADMILTPDHPSWHSAGQAHDHDHGYAQQRTSSDTEGSAGGIGIGSGPGSMSGRQLPHDPSAPYTGGRVSTENTGQFRAGPDADSYLPPGAVPQGARFDPIMPDDVRRGLPNRGPGAGGQGGLPRGLNPPSHGSGEPDFDEILPPH